MKRYGLKLVSLLLALFLLCGTVMIGATEGEDAGGEGTTGETTAGEGDASGDDKNAVTMKSMTAEEKIASMEKVTDNSSLIMYTDKITGEIAIKDKESGSLYFSNPTNVEDYTAMGDDIKNELYSQIVIDYYDSALKPGTFTSFQKCVQLSQLKAVSIDNGIQYDMTIGREEQRLLLPLQMPASRFDELLEKIGEVAPKMKTKFKYAYKGYVRADMKSEKAIADAEKAYPVFKQTDLYVIRNTVSTKERADLEAAVKATGYTFEDMDAD